MKNCPNCGLEMDDRARFCSLCGFEFKGQSRHSAFDDMNKNEQVQRNEPAKSGFDPTENTQTFSTSDDTIYFNAPHDNANNGMNAQNEPTHRSYGRSEDTSARPPVRRMADNGYRSNNINDNINNVNRSEQSYNNNDSFDNYGYDEEEQPPKASDSGIETDKPGRNNALIILSAAAVFAAIVLVVLIFALASKGSKKNNDKEISKVTTAKTEQTTEALEEETEEETEKPTEAETKKETTKVTKERVKAEDIAERKCYIDSDDDELYSYKSEYVLNDMEKKTERELWDGLELAARRTCHSHKKNWYECWSLDNGEYIGWVDEKLLTFGQKEKPEESEQPEQNDPISVDGSGILHVDFDIAAYDYRSIQDYLGIQLGDQIDFPFWGINDLKYALGDYKDNKVCFVFRYDKLVAVVYETVGGIDQDFLNNASAVYGGYNTIEEGRKYGFTANRGYIYIMEQENLGYTDHGDQDVVHQRIMVSELYQNGQQQQQGNQWDQPWNTPWGQFWN